MCSFFFLGFLFVSWESIFSDVIVVGNGRWGCSPGKYQLKFDAEETCYLLKGKVKAYPKGDSGNEEGGFCVEFGAGDLVILPKGLSCTWDVSVAVDKHYKFESTSSSSPSSSSSF